jgi:tetratricopeptide (TPR) repeat protein
MQDKALDEARALEAEGLDEEALSLVNSVLAGNEDFMEAYLERAKIHLNRNTYDLAARDYREAISCSASSVEAHYGLGLACEKWAERLEASGNSARAYEKFREAVLEYKKTLWYSHGHAPAYYGLGCAYSRLGMREDARYYFKRAIENAEHNSDLARRARYNMQLLGEY